MNADGIGSVASIEQALAHCTKDRDEAVRAFIEKRASHFESR